MTRKSIFHEDWWLDALAPGRWREVTCIRGGRVVGYLRFVERCEGGMKICEMPQITRLLGPVVVKQTGKAEARIRSTHSIITELLEQIAGHDHVEMNLDTGFGDLAPFLASGYEVKVHPTLLLDCKRPLEDLWAGLRDKTRNVIRRARERLVVRDVDDVERFVGFYEANLEGEEAYFDLSLLVAGFAAAHAHRQCKIVAATDPDGLAHAMVLLIWDDKYVHYFLSTRNKTVAHPGAVSLLLWTGIELAHSMGLSFDFDGGMANCTRYKFMVAFGGESANRFEIRRTTALYQVQRTVRRIPRAIARRLSSNSSIAAARDAVRRHAAQSRAIKTALMPIARSIALLPWVSHVVRNPSVRNVLARLPGASSLLAGTSQVAGWDRVHPFDIAHGTDTSGFVPTANLDQLEHEAAREQSMPYGGSQPSIIRTALAALPSRDTFTFLDLGCGKGRPLLVASELPFRDIVGVELSASLAATARHNAALMAQRFPQRTPIRVVTGDASRFPLPAGNLVVFLYNPFGDEVIANVAAAVNAALMEAQRSIYVVYYNPVFGHRFDALPRLHRHFAGTLPYAAEELGYGPDAEDPIVVWQGGVALAPIDAGAKARIEVIDPRSRVRLVPA